MNDRVRLWWGLRSVREQRLLLVMLALVAITLVFLLVIRPLGDLLADARADAARAAIAAGEARGQGDTIRTLERDAPAVLRQPVPRIVADAAAEAGFGAGGIEPAPDGGATLTLDSARAPALFGWVAAMEARRGLVVEALRAQPTGDRTISATVTFRERGR